MYDKANTVIQACRGQRRLTPGQGKFTVTLIEGDGIGPEISQSVKDIYSAANVSWKQDHAKFRP